MLALKTQGLMRAEEQVHPSTEEPVWSRIARGRAG